MLSEILENFLLCNNKIIFCKLQKLNENDFIKVDAELKYLFTL